MYASRLRTAGRFAVLAAAFALSYAQSPLYTSNQNQYFLHAAARAGKGYLHQDWLANTLDPTPVFSLLVELVLRLVQVEAVFYVLYAALMGVYVVSVLGIVQSVFDIQHTRPGFLAFLALFFMVHSAGLRFGLSRILGDNWTYVLEDGVADQRLLGPVFQPSVFGVLLVLSIYLFLRGKPYRAVLAAVLAATFHPTYLLSAAALTAGYLLATLLGEGPGKQRGWRAISMGALALALVLPILAYTAANFGVTSPGDTPAGATVQARQILVHYRIPHHALASWWFDATAVFKICLVGLGLFLARRSRLFPILAVCSLTALGLSLVQVVTQSNALAMVFPWRLSVFLVPLSMALVLGFTVTRLAERYPDLLARYSREVMQASLVLVGVAILVGGVRFGLDLQRRNSAPARPMLAYVAAHHRAGEVYLTPVKLQEFRLETGSPAYVDFKSIPYRDVDVLEWRRRIAAAEGFYAAPGCAAAQALAAQEGITHVVMEGNQPALTCPGVVQVFRDEAYGVYSIEGGG